MKSQKHVRSHLISVRPQVGAFRLWADNKLITLEGDGKLLTNPSPKGFQVTASAQLLSNLSWTPPATAGCRDTDCSVAPAEVSSYNCAIHSHCGDCLFQDRSAGFRQLDFRLASFRRGKTG